MQTTCKTNSLRLRPLFLFLLGIAAIIHVVDFFHFVRISNFIRYILSFAFFSTYLIRFSKLNNPRLVLTIYLIGEFFLGFVDLFNSLNTPTPYSIYIYSVVLYMILIGCAAACISLHRTGKLLCILAPLIRILGVIFHICYFQINFEVSFFRSRIMLYHGALILYYATTSLYFIVNPIPQRTKHPSPDEKFTNSIKEELSKLDNQYQNKLITLEEYENLRAEIIRRI